MPIGNSVLCYEEDLADVFPQYVTFASLGYGGKGTALMHKNMALLKSHITGKYVNGNGIMARDVKVYEIIKGKPHLLYELPAGSVKSESDLWKKRPKDRAVVVDEDDLAAALESIGKAMG